jgi:hypothetical protein
MVLPHQALHEKGRGFHMRNKYTRIAYAKIREMAGTKLDFIANPKKDFPQAV